MSVGGVLLILGVDVVGGGSCILGCVVCLCSNHAPETIIGAQGPFGSLEGIVNGYIIRCVLPWLQGSRYRGMRSSPQVEVTQESSTLFLSSILNSANVFVFCFEDSEEYLF